jgi:hypothetical protein
MISPELEGRIIRSLRRARWPMHLLPRRVHPIPLANVREITLKRPAALAAVERAVPSAARHLDRFSAFWDNEVVPVAIEAHRGYGGQYAGAGPVDFLEAFTLYALTRELQPDRVLELGFAAGISSWVLATGLIHNGHGELDTVDIKDGGSIIPQFHDLAARGVIHPHFGDACAFVQNGSGPYQLTFSDALHTYDFNMKLAKLLHERLPMAVHCFHEWSLGPGIPSNEARYVSLRANLGTCGERRAFEQVFTVQRHVGIPSSSGLGVVLP